MKHPEEGSITVLRCNDRHLSFTRQLFELLVDIGVSVSHSWLVILQKQRRIENRVKRL